MFLILYFVKHFFRQVFMNTISGLYPQMLWKYFIEISSIPRLSRNEGMISEYLMEFARELGLEYSKDETGNIIICKPATEGYQDRKTVILQSHLDMVGEKEQNSGHDFKSDPIKPVRDGEWITASGTTLGADDGIGIAAQMMVLSDNSIEHGPIECLFTMDEESGMTGAKGLKSGSLRGSILLNLDSEDWGELFIGCAGGIDTLGYFNFDVSKPGNEYSGYRISVSGLNGGHSGDEIHKSPGNSIKILSRILINAGLTNGLLLCNMDGGNLRNAIPREANAEFYIPRDKLKKFHDAFIAEKTIIHAELEEFESGLTIELEETKPGDKVIQADQQNSFLRTLNECPHGVISWSSSIDSLVETSTNLASVKFTDPGKAIVTSSQRSSVESAKNQIAERIATCFRQGGAKTEHTDGYPGWTPNTDSEILKIVSLTYQRLFDQDPIVRAIHAGLECGLILEKFPDLDMVSFGPTIKGAHTPTERLHIESTGKFWDLLIEVLKSIPKQK
jgi:dipeptidase D